MNSYVYLPILQQAKIKYEVDLTAYNAHHLQRVGTMGRQKSRKVAQTVLLYLEGSVLVAFRKKGESVYNLTLPEEHLVYDLLSEHR